jgi:hypothetical protein
LQVTNWFEVTDEGTNFRRILPFLRRTIVLVLGLYWWTYSERSKTVKNRLITLAVLVALLASFAFTPARSASAQVAIPVTGTFTDALGGTGTFAGSFDIQRFTARGGQLLAIGTLTGTLTDSLGTVLGTVTRQITLPVGVAQASCEILDLTLGPLDLNLLGLVVHLDVVHLDITAEQGPGNLLGNLLCAVAGLLDNTPSLAGLAQLLNQILNILG